MLRSILSLIGLVAVACTPFESATDELLVEDAQGGSSAETRTGSLLPPEEGRDWSCIGDLVADGPGVARSSADAMRLLQSVQVLSLAAGTVPPGVTVRACAQVDVGCINPITPSVPIDTEGWADLPLYDGFDGYLEITGSTIVPLLLFYQYPLSANSRRDTTAVGAVERALLPTLTAAIGTQQDPALGLITLRAFDCNNDEAPGVQYAIDRTGLPWYFVSGLPSGKATETERSGLGGFLNVPSGITVVQVALSSRERVIALPKALLSRPDWMTALRLLPTLRAPTAAAAQ